MRIGGVIMGIFNFLKRKEEETGISRKVVLIISGDSDRNKSLEKEIKQYSLYDVVIAQSGKDGIRQSRRVHPDIIFLDWDIDEPSGPEVIFQIKRLKRTKDVPLCVLMRGNRMIDYELAQTANISDYIMKPCSSEKILDLIKARTEG